ncbi:TPA: TIR domain-containing protein [Elizabethkingia anophelis]
MGRKIFVSYKYADTQVENLDSTGTNLWGTKEKTTARHYVDELSKYLSNDDHIYKGEADNESMASLTDSTIASKLGDKIFDSSITIVLISKGMKNLYLSERDQWIPWEISYSLKEQTRQNTSSKTNGIIALVIPDELGSYEYYITRNNECNCRNLNTDFLFKILSENMFNIKVPERTQCNGSWIYSGYSSYIQSVKWEFFIKSPTTYIEKAIELRDKREEYNITKIIK